MRQRALRRRVRRALADPVLERNVLRSMGVEGTTVEGLAER